MIIFLDANVEVNDGWFEPLLSRIASDRSVVAVPRIDYINNYNMTYEELNRTVIFGLGWNLFHYQCVIFAILNKFGHLQMHSNRISNIHSFHRYPLPEREITRNRGDPTAPFRTPAIMGTAIAIDREFFFEIGAFDKKLNFWGGDNSELSLRVRFSTSLSAIFFLQ